MNRLTLVSATVLSVMTLTVQAQSPAKTSSVQTGVSATAEPPAQITLGTLRQQERSLQQQLLHDIDALVMIKMRIAAEEKIAARIPALSNGFEWVAVTSNKMPANVFVVDPKAKQVLAICQARHFGNIYPGYVQANTCVITYAGQAYPLQDYKVLVSQKKGLWRSVSQVSQQVMSLSEESQWQPVIYYTSPTSQVVMGSPHSSDLPTDMPVIGGKESGHYVYICRVMLNGIYHVGKTVSGSCMFAMLGKEASLPDYQILFPG